METLKEHKKHGRSGIKEWLFTTDHKRIAILYLATSLTVFVVGLLLAFAMKTEQWSPGRDIMNAKLYNVFFTIHGAGMILWWMIPVFTGFFANLLVPLMIGARDVAFPRLNALSYWAFAGATVMAVLGLVLPGRLDIGWTGYPPYSITSDANTSIYVFAVHLLGISALTSAVNFITTIITMRAPGMTWGRLNLAVWGILGAFIIQLFGIPVLAGAVTLLLFDKYLGTNFYNAAMGGSSMLYQHLFWFYAHPAVYVIALPAFGIVSEIVSTFSRKKIFGYGSMAIALMSITFLGFEVWIHHLFTKGVEDWARIVQSLLTILIGVPTGIKVFNWLATMHRGSIDFRAPMLYTVGFITLFVVGGVTGIANGLLSLNLHLHDTYWIVAHFHTVLSMSMTLLAFGGIYFWFPKFTGRMYNERLAKAAFWIILIGSFFAFVPMFKLGLEGMPRRYWAYPAEFMGTMRLTVVGGYVLILGFVLTLFNVIHSAFAGEKATANPWNAKSLEWTLPSPVPAYNFATIPVITAGPYEYGTPVKPEAALAEEMNVA
jgi:cytochrome c oxidase subunit 1